VFWKIKAYSEAGTFSALSCQVSNLEEFFPVLTNGGWFYHILGKGWQTYVWRDQNGTRKDLLGTRHSQLYQFSSALLASMCCETYVCKHISGCIEIVYELPLLPNNTTSETLLHQSGALWSFDWKLSFGAPARRWLGEYVTLDKTFYFLLFKQEVIAARVTSTFSSLSHSSRRLWLTYDNSTVH